MYKVYYVLYRIRKRIAATLAALGDAALFLGIIVFAGLGSAWYFIQMGTALTTVRIGPWIAWTNAARADADPYTRAHFARAGTIPLPGDAAATFVARTDSAGTNLQSACDYVIEGRMLAAPWWSLSVFDSQGRLISNPLQRYGYTSENVALRGDGSFLITLAREVQPGNWIPSGHAPRLALVFTVIEPPANLDGWDTNALKLPSIRRVSCR